MWQSLLFSQPIKNNLSNRCGIALNKPLANKSLGLPLFHEFFAFSRTKGWTNVITPLWFCFFCKFSALSFKGQSPLQPRSQEHPDFRVRGIFIGRIRDWKCRESLSTTELKEHLVWTYSTLVSGFKCLVRWTKLFLIDVFLYKNKTSQGTLIIFLSFKLY